MNETPFIELLSELADSKLVKVTGSYADGTQTENSDIDFYVKPDSPDYKYAGKERNIVKVKRILDKYKVKMESNMVGYWYSHKSENNIPIQIEFSDLFEKRKNRLKEVNLLGVIFKTY